MRVNIGTQRLAVLAVLWLAPHHLTYGQTTNTTTNCTLSGNTANCTSTSTDDKARRAQQAEQQREAYETGQEIGTALGQGIARARQVHAFNKGLRNYCAAHPGEDWHYSSRTDGHEISSGHCPTDDDKVTAAANEFVSHHKDFMRTTANAQALVAYAEANKLDPRERKTYERAYKDLKKAGQLGLYDK